VSLQYRIVDRRNSLRKLRSMAIIRNVSAVIFDMDGTLIDSEIFTAQAVATLLHESSVFDVDIDDSEFAGVSWENIAQRLVEQVPQLSKRRDIPSRLHDIFQALLKNDPPVFINMARETVLAASSLFPTAIVSSSNRDSIEETIRRMDIEANIKVYIGAEDSKAGKPFPDGYLKAAELLGVKACECLVFEDSVTGIQAARNAGMQVVAITHSSSDIDKVTNLADMAIRDFSELEKQFFVRARKQV